MNKAVIIESPYAGDVKLNKVYLQHCIREATKRGLTPYASHQMLTEALDDTVPEERALGIALGLVMRDLLLSTNVTEVWFCTDLGWSKGMLYAKASAPSNAKEMSFFEDGELELFKASVSQRQGIPLLDVLTERNGTLETLVRVQSQRLLQLVVECQQLAKSAGLSDYRPPSLDETVAAEKDATIAELQKNAAIPDIGKAFHDLAVKERDYERMRSCRLETALSAALAEVAQLKEELKLAWSDEGDPLKQELEEERERRRTLEARLEPIAPVPSDWSHEFLGNLVPARCFAPDQGVVPAWRAHQMSEELRMLRDALEKMSHGK